jgi:hypothetical protein
MGVHRYRLLVAALCGLFGGCAQDACEVDASGPECTQTFHLEIPARCVPAQVTLSSFYGRIINARCSSVDCHGGAMFPKYGPDNAATFLDQVLHRSPSRNAMPYLRYVRPRDPDNSFLLYKVVQSATGATQQGKIQLGGGPMPQGRMPLTAEEQCTLINWVRSGAN